MKRGERTPEVDAGWSLLELIIVLAIVSSAVVLVSITTRGARGALAADAAARTVIAILDEARASALLEGRDVTIALDEPLLVRRIREASGDRRTIVGMVAEAYAHDRTDRHAIRFRSNGSSSPAAVRVQAGEAHVTIAVEPLTGRARVTGRSQ